ncbi:MAG TPA: ABC transporter substrate-binding protein [Acidimicrobiales bacterium]|nr:ABC transporter substrate-binding protein [Acidimicrobiales bacterium]
MEAGRGRTATYYAAAAHNVSAGHAIAGYAIGAPSGQYGRSNSAGCATLGDAIPRHAIPRHAIPRHTTSRHTTSRHATSGRATSGHANIGRAAPGHARRRAKPALVMAGLAIVVAFLASGCGTSGAAAAERDGATFHSAFHAVPYAVRLVKTAVVNPPIPAPAAAGRATTSTTTAAPGATAASSLVIAPRTEASFTDNFNPFDSSAPLEQIGVTSYIYEPLLQYDELQLDQYYPWLAASWSFSSSGFTITFNLRSGVRWDDGSALTAADAAYTFNLLKDNPAINDGIPIVSAVASGPATFVLTLGRPGYAYLYDIARVPIVKTGYAAKAPVESYVDRAPDGTGPYVLAGRGGYSPAKVVLAARAKYWQGEAPVRQLVFPALADNTAVLSWLESGKLDWAGSELPEVAEDYVARDPKEDHYWAPAVDSIALEVNLALPGFDKLDVRQAISDAIDRVSLSKQAGGGIDAPVSTLSGLVLPTDAQFLEKSDSDDVDENGATGAVAALMRAAGYQMGPQGYWANARTGRLEVNIEDPSGTTLENVAAAVAQQLSASGFDASASAPPAAKWHSDLVDGTFEASVVTGTSGPSPFYMYQGWLDASLVSGGRATSGDYERFSATTMPGVAPAVASDLQSFTNSLSDSPGALAAVSSLAAIVARELPVVPLLYGGAWGEFSSRHMTGWPSSQNPYEPATPRGAFAEYTVLQLSPVT